MCDAWLHSWYPSVLNSFVHLHVTTILKILFISIITIQLRISTEIIVYQKSDMILEFGYDIGSRIYYIKIQIWHQKSDILYWNWDMISEVGYIISEFGYDIGSQIYYIGIRIWYKTLKKLCDYIIWLFDSNGTP